jgi:hypothetical protein
MAKEPPTGCDHRATEAPNAILRAIENELRLLPKRLGAVVEEAETIRRDAHNRRDFIERLGRPRGKKFRL